MSDIRDAADYAYPLMEQNMPGGIRFYDNKQNAGYQKHWHNSFEIILPVEGGYQVEVEDTLYSVGCGEVLVIPSRVIHSILQPSGGERYIFIIDHNNISSMRDMSVTMLGFYPCVLLTEAHGGDTLKRVREYLTHAADEYIAGQLLGEAAAREWLNLALLTLGRASLESGSPIEGEPPQSKRQAASIYLSVCNHIVENCNQKITLEDMARFSGYSKYHFTRMFKKFAGMSFYDFYMRQRMLLCERLLTDASLSITEAALQSGFGSIATFNRVFREYKGMTPTAFRKAMWQSHREVWLKKRPR